MIRNATELVQSGQNAIVIFTHGDLFTHNQDGDGSTGNWTAGVGSLENGQSDHLSTWCFC